MDLPGIDKARKLDLHAGDRVLVHLDREPTDQQAHEIRTGLLAAVGVDVKVIVMPPGIDLEVQPDAVHAFTDRMLES